MNTKIIYMDTETTGLDEKMNDIIQLAIIIEIDGEIKEKKSWKVRPFPVVFACDMEAIVAHGYTVDIIKTFPDPRLIYKELISVLSKYVDKFNKFDKFSVCGHNVEFDIKFLKLFFEKNSDKYYGSWFNWSIIDTMKIVQYLNGNNFINTGGHNLTSSCKFFNIPLVEAHDAMADIEATRKLKLELDKIFIDGLTTYVHETVENEDKIINE